jgi:phospho-N-acetylmuramoyl-pentapeptide-transferase
MLYILLDETRDWLQDHGMYWAFRLLDEIQFRALASAGLSFLIVVIAGRPTIRRLRRMKIGDTGLTDAEALRAHTASKANTPTMGGVLIAGALLTSLLLLADLREFYTSLALLLVLWLAVLGGFDDWLKLTSVSRGSGSRQGLYAWEKLVFQLGVGLLVGIFAYRHGDTEAAGDLAHVLNLPLQKTYVRTEGLGFEMNPGLIFMPATAYVLVMVLMVAGMSNAVNITDGMDGLAAGIGAVVSLGLLVLTFVAGWQAGAQYLLVPHVEFARELTVLGGGMLGACLGFLWWNCSPAQVFMGDTGSLCLGGLMGYIAVVIRQEIVVLLMCGVFLAEIASVVIQVGYFKATKGRRVFRCAPFHHHLHLGGWTEQQVVARLWIISILLVVAALASLKVR